jgi:hypothetical protein
MNTHTTNRVGFVYVLAEGLSLPVCKIGRTTQADAEIRCAQINSGSTGDFKWHVKHTIAVNDCVAFESVVHRSLAHCRQDPRKEMFGLTADEAYAHILTLLARQSEIKEVHITFPLPLEKEKKEKKARGTNAGGYVVKAGDEAYARILQSYLSCLQIKDYDNHGQWRSQHFGIHEKVCGVQWNIDVLREAQKARLGINLEGSGKTGDWLIGPFVLSELNRPTLDLVKAKVAAPDQVRLWFGREAWQGAVRYDIVERDIGGRPFMLSEVDDGLWRQLLAEAKGCLDPKKQYRGRVAQTVTMRKTGEKVLWWSDTKPQRGVSPHLHISTGVEADPKWDQDKIDMAMKRAIALLKPIHDWVSKFR